MLATFGLYSVLSMTWTEMGESLSLVSQSSQYWVFTFYVTHHWWHSLVGWEIWQSSPQAGAEFAPSEGQVELLLIRGRAENCHRSCPNLPRWSCFTVRDWKSSLQLAPLSISLSSAQSSKERKGSNSFWRKCILKALLLPSSPEVPC